jgi:hypothetical protein
MEKPPGCPGWNIKCSENNMMIRQAISGIIRLRTHHPIRRSEDDAAEGGVGVRCNYEIICGKVIPCIALSKDVSRRTLLLNTLTVAPSATMSISCVEASTQPCVHCAKTVVADAVFSAKYNTPPVLTTYTRLFPSVNLIEASAELPAS